MKKVKKGRFSLLKKSGLGLICAVALSATLSAGSAYAAGTTQVGGDGANWSVPTYSMTNTIWKDADGNVVPEGTEGATQYKVLTTWAEAWSTSGADYLGISNSAFFGNGGNGNAKIETYEAAAKTTTVGVWATAANESPNAYNWNMFYNLYANTEDGIAAGAVPSDWTSTVTSTNGGSDWASDAGVWCGFKFRPDVVVTNNNLSEDAAKTYIEQIRNGQYSATATKTDDGTYAPDTEDGTYDSSFYVPGDENYNPSIMGYNNNSPYSFVASAYQLAELADDVVADTANYSGLGDEELTWKTVNLLPRSNRYTETPIECAVNIESLAKGSVYYALSQINAGNVEKKTVAYVAYPWNYSSNSVNTDDSHVVVAVYDYTENIGTGPMDGRASWTPLAVNQVSTDSVAVERTGGGAVNSTDESTTTYTLYYATADDLADADVIYCSPNAAVSATEFQEWIEQNSTSNENIAHASEMSYLTTWPCITNGSNYTFEKLIYGALGMDFIYPELFPSMQLSSYWCDEIYHLTDEALPSAMSWIYASSSIPAGTDLSNIPAQYDMNTVVNKLYAGLDYFNATSNEYSSTDETLNRVINNIGIDGSATYGDGNTYAFNGIQPTEYWQASATDRGSNEIIFSDVDTGAWAYNAITWAASKGYLTGYGDGTYGTYDNLTRAQAAIILWRYLDPTDAAAFDQNNTPNTTGMSDVADNAYYTGAANWAVANGIITGSNGSFDPDGTITRDQLCTILARALSNGAYETTDTSAFYAMPDASEVEWGVNEIAWCLNEGLINGSNQNGTLYIAPHDPVDRSQMAQILYNMAA